MTNRHKRSRDNASVLFLPRVRTAPEPANRTRHAPSAEACPRRRFAWRVVRLAARSNLDRRTFSYTHAHNASVLFLPRVRTAREPAKQNATRPVLRDLPSSTCRRWRVGDLRSIDRSNERSSFVTPRVYSTDNSTRFFLVRYFAARDADTRFVRG